MKVGYSVVLVCDGIGRQLRRYPDCRQSCCRWRAQRRRCHRKGQHLVRRRLVPVHDPAPDHGLAPAGTRRAAAAAADRGVEAGPDPVRRAPSPARGLARASRALKVRKNPALGHTVALPRKRARKILRYAKKRTVSRKSGTTAQIKTVQIVKLSLTKIRDVSLIQGRLDASAAAGTDSADAVPRPAV